MPTWKNSLVPPFKKLNSLDDLGKPMNATEKKAQVIDMLTHESVSDMYLANDVHCFIQLCNLYPEIEPELADFVLSGKSLVPRKTAYQKAVAKVVHKRVGITKLDSKTLKKNKIDPELLDQEVSPLQKLYRLAILAQGSLEDPELLREELIQRQKRLLLHIEQNSGSLEWGDLPAYYFDELLMRASSPQVNFHGLDTSALQEKHSFEDTWSAFGVEKFHYYVRGHKRILSERRPKTREPEPLPEKVIQELVDARVQKHKTEVSGTDRKILASVSLKILERTLKDFSKCEDYQEVFASMNSDSSKEYIAIIRSIVLSNPEQSPENLEARIENITVSSWSGGPESEEYFTPEVRQFVQKNHQDIYSQMKNMPEILDGKIEKELQNPQAKFTLIHYQGNPVAIRKVVCVDSEKNIYYVGTFYIEKAFHGMSHLIQNWDYLNLPPGATLFGTIAPHNLNALRAFTNSGWDLVEFTTEEFENLESPPMLLARRQLTKNEEKPSKTHTTDPSDLTDTLQALFDQELEITSIEPGGNRVKVKTRKK